MDPVVLTRRACLEAEVFHAWGLESIVVACMHVGGGVVQFRIVIYRLLAF